jgi:dTMP kinase
VDFWDRLERQIIPALRAGMVVLADRYVFSLIARAAVRGVSVSWMEDVYGFCLIPDKVIYLDIDIDHLLPRVLGSTGFDYWESGQDFLPAKGMFQSFVRYQNLLLEQFRSLAKRYGFTVIDARSSIADVFKAVRAEVESVVMTTDAPSAAAEAAPLTSPAIEGPSG